MNREVNRCWNTTEPLYIKYHDEEWGVPVHDDKRHFEFLILDAFQAGLSWWIILQRREKLRIAFGGFDPEKIAKYTVEDVNRLMSAEGMIKNKAKIAAAITNAQGFLKIQREFGLFDAFIWQFVGGKTKHNAFTEMSELPAESVESEAMSQELKNRGFKFVGPTICYAYMQAAGLVNDHLVGCFRYKQLKKLNPVK
jgi:DNA-3-methyladenine glycosylase I